jgi:hypothetical protein
MAKYGRINSTLWNSKKWRSLRGAEHIAHDRPRLLYHYLHDNPHRNSVGTYVLPPGYACEDLGWDSEGYREAMDRLCQASLVVWDTDESVVHIVGAIDQDPPTNERHARGMYATLDDLPDCEGKALAIQELQHQKHFPEDLSLSIASPKPMERTGTGTGVGVGVGKGTGTGAGEGVPRPGTRCVPPKRVEGPKV